MDDLGEGFGLEAGTAYKRAVDLGLTHQGGDVVGFDGAAVEDAHAAGARETEVLGHFAANDGVGVVGLFRCGDAAGADGPDGFVGDHQPAAGGSLDAVERAGDLPA